MKLKMAKLTAQQGDVVLRKIKSLPPASTKTVLARKRLVLAEGEHGNAHVIEDDEAELIQVGEKMLLSLTKPATVTHGEHGPIRLASGLWEIGHVKEYDWFQQMTRQVID
jgi:hypothetical protein